MFAKAREKARQASCLSNEKQIGLGLLQYAQDYDETMVPDWDDEGPWSTLIQPQVKNYQVFTCPDTDDQKAKDGKPGYDGSSGGYSLNCAYGNNGDNSSHNPPGSMAWRGDAGVRKLSRYADAAGTALALEGTGTPWLWWEGVSDQPTGVNATANPPRLDGIDDSAALARHNDLTDVLWCDGHVKAVPLSYLNERGPAPDYVLKHFTIEND